MNRLSLENSLSNKNICVTNADAQRIDNKAIKEMGIPGEDLMAKAGYLAAFEALELIWEYSLKTCQIFVGKGNNGGDGFVLATELTKYGIQSDVFVIPAENEIQGDSLFHYKKMLSTGIKPVFIHLVKDISNELKADALWVDALLGTGLNSTIRGIIKELIDTLTELKSNQKVLAIDIPSGLDGSSGLLRGNALKADVTVTMGFYKTGNFLQDGKYYNGKLILADLGYPDESLKARESDMYICNEELIRKIILPLTVTSHKYSVGQMTLMGGHSLMSGAVALSAKAALRSGCGMLQVITTETVAGDINTLSMESIVHAIPGEALSGSAVMDKAKELEARTQAWVLGPGLGRNKETGRFVLDFLKTVKETVVLDADALFHLSEDYLLENKASVIITPHWGEFSRLFNIENEVLKENTLDIVSEKAQKYKMIIHLKSSSSITAFPDGKLFIHKGGAPGMATAGSGDVLSGMIGSFLAQGQSPEEAVLIAAWFHEQAGIAAAKKYGNRSLIAGDIIDFIPQVLKDYETYR